MNYFSTRNEKEVVSSAEAIVKGLAADGGLFIPERMLVQFQRFYLRILYYILLGQSPWI